MLMASRDDRAAACPMGGVARAAAHPGTVAKNRTRHGALTRPAAARRGRNRESAPKSQRWRWKCRFGFQIFEIRSVESLENFGTLKMQQPTPNTDDPTDRRARVRRHAAPPRRAKTQCAIGPPRTGPQARGPTTPRKNAMPECAILPLFDIRHETFPLVSDPHGRRRHGRVSNRSSSWSSSWSLGPGVRAGGRVRCKSPRSPHVRPARTREMSACHART